MQPDHRRVNTVNNRALNGDGRYVLYWMQHSQRARTNPAFERAVDRANACNLPLLVVFVVDPAYPQASARHFTFMLEGIAETMAAVRERGAHMSLRKGNPPDVVIAAARDAAVVVMDRGYLRHLVDWRRAVAEAAPCLVEMVESDVIVPVEAASDKRETAARTIRNKLARAMGDLDEGEPQALARPARGLRSEEDCKLGSVARFVEALGCDGSIAPVKGLKGGTGEARKRLARFVAEDLPHYGEGRADIVERHVSHLGPYLHFGQISPVEVYRAVKTADAPETSKASFIDELLTRRELAVNFVHNTPDYDRFSAMPAWARETLEAHARDEREAVYPREDLVEGKTGDRYWNAAMREMRLTGYLHNHMRMYWGKRLIAYTQSPQEAYRIALDLNNTYLLDGRDANSYANVGWLFGLHDRGWPERPVFGKVRTMTAGGLERKFDANAYVEWADRL